MNNNIQLEELMRVQNALMNALTDNARAMRYILHPVIVIKNNCSTCLNKLEDIKAGKMVPAKCPECDYEITLLPNYP